MPFRWRPDGTYIQNLPNTRRIMPFLMKGRNESLVFYEQKLQVDKVWKFLEDYARQTGLRVTILHYIMWRVAQVLHLRPGLNRFVAGKRIYQRKDIWINFSMKKEKVDGSPIVVGKLKVDPFWSFDELIKRVEEVINRGRSGGRSASDVEMDLVFMLPNFMVSFFVWLLRTLNHFGWLPASMIDHDEMYGSVFIANLGSIGVDAAYHHLYEYGNVSIFVAIGQKKPEVVVGENGEPAVKEVLILRYTFDERIEDGLYAMKALQYFKELVENPELKVEDLTNQESSAEA